MLETIFDFVFTVPLENSLLRALIMVAEILVMGFVMYCWWEMVPRMAHSITRISKAAIGSGTVRPDKTPASALR